MAKFVICTTRCVSTATFGSRDSTTHCWGKASKGGGGAVGGCVAAAAPGGKLAVARLGAGQPNLLANAGLALLTCGAQGPVWQRFVKATAVGGVAEIAGAGVGVDAVGVGLLPAGAGGGAGLIGPVVHANHK